MGGIIKKTVLPNKPSICFQTFTPLYHWHILGKCVYDGPIVSRTERSYSWTTPSESLLWLAFSASFPGLPLLQLCLCVCALFLRRNLHSLVDTLCNSDPRDSHFARAFWRWLRKQEWRAMLPEPFLYLNRNKIRKTNVYERPVVMWNKISQQTRSPDIACAQGGGCPLWSQSWQSPLLGWMAFVSTKRCVSW
jgi:hypothetical protein